MLLTPYDAAVRELAPAAAIVGGLIWITTVVLTAVRPIVDAYRSTLDLHPTILVAFALIAWAATRLASDLGRKPLVWPGAAASWVAVALFSVNVAVVLATGDDAPVWPTHYASFFLIALGIGLLGLATFRRRVVPAALAVAMIAAPVIDAAWERPGRPRAAVAPTRTRPARAGARSFL